MVYTLRRLSTRTSSLVAIAIVAALALVVRDSISGSPTDTFQKRDLASRNLVEEVVTITINACPAPTIEPSAPSFTGSLSSSSIPIYSQTLPPLPSSTIATTLQTSTSTAVSSDSSSTTPQSTPNPTIPVSSLNSPIPASSPDYKSPCDTSPVPTGDIYIYLYNTTGPDTSGYEYTLNCNTWFPGIEVIKTLTTPNYNDCLDACYQWNQVFDLATQSICYSVTTSPASSASELTCYLQPPPEVNAVYREGWNSAIWIAD